MEDAGDVVAEVKSDTTLSKPIVSHDMEVSEATAKALDDSSVKFNKALLDKLDSLVYKASPASTKNQSESTTSSGLSTPVKRRVKALKKLQMEYIMKECKFVEELHELECKYATLCEPLFKQRWSIVTGAVEPTDSDCDWPSDEDDDNEWKEKENPEAKPSPQSDANDSSTDGVAQALAGTKSDALPQGIPGFWLRVFKNTYELKDVIQEWDIPILEHLTDVKLRLTAGEPTKFTLEFVFEPNEYFTNSVLTKEYTRSIMPDKASPLLFDGPELSKCQGCVIDWKDGKNVTMKKVTKCVKVKSKGEKKTVSKIVPADSFFKFFSPPQVEDGEELDSDDQDTLETDFNIASCFREEIISRAILFFIDEDDDASSSSSSAEEEGEEEEDASDGK